MAAAPGQERFSAFEESRSVKHDDTAASPAADFDIRTRTDHRPYIAAARMFFSGPDNISQTNVIHPAQHLQQISFLLYSEKENMSKEQ